jgi:sugar lactone lactonase YvrE
MPRCDPLESSASISTVDVATGSVIDLGPVSKLAFLAWSPRGDRIGYKTADSLYVIRADGTGQVKLADALDNSFGWSLDGQWLLFHRTSFDLWIVPVDGGAVPRILGVDIGGASW